MSAHEVALATDLYQLTMGASYHTLGMNRTAIFSLFVRTLPPDRSFLVVAGLEEALDRVREIHFDNRSIDYLRSIGQISGDFLEALAEFRFTGDIWAVPEGRAVLANEPILEVQAPIIEAQLVETAIVNAMHFPTLVATKAARCVAAAPGATLIDFGLRRTPSIDAGMAVARAAYVAGFAATSNVLAGERYGIPVAGTIAHSFIEAFPSELEAFRAFATTFPGPVTLLIDTYDTIGGARHAAQVATELRGQGKRVAAVRIDSGDLAALSRAVRAILDEAGCADVQIVASGGLDESDLAELTQAGAPIDAYGVGTKLGTSADAPTLDMAYKLVQYADAPTLKLSVGKETLIGPKQVWRHRDAHGRYDRDRIAARDEPAPGPDWEPLLIPVMEGGAILRHPALAESRTLHQREMAAFPPGLRDLASGSSLPLEVSPTLTRRQREAVAAIRRRERLPVPA